MDSYMYTQKEWLIIVRNILAILGYDTISLGIDEDIDQLPTDDVRIAYRNTLQDILNDDDWGDEYSTLGDPY